MYLFDRKKVVSGMVMGLFSSSCFALEFADADTDFSSAGILVLGALALIIGRAGKMFRQD